MSIAPSPTFRLAGPEATARAATLLVPVLAAGDVLLLQGNVGAGKTTFARALIQGLLAQDARPVEDVPSPTFTLVQTYETSAFEIWHADLYRLTQAEEVLELGLADAFEDGLCLIEWPDRLGADTPPTAVTLSFAPDGPDARLLRLQGGPRAGVLAAALEKDLPAMPTRDDEIDAFLDASGWGDAVRAPLAGDASRRRYVRLHQGDRRAMLMDAAPEVGEDVRPFLSVGTLLRDLGLSAPETFASNADRGLLVIEDLGDDLFSTVAREDPTAEPALYAAAGEVLARLQSAAPPATLDDYGAAMAELAGLSLDWYAPEGQAARGPLVDAMAQALTHPAVASTAFVHRDFHADNLLWLPQRDGLARVGLLDFQDAMRGPPEYDLASLIHDPRRTVSPAARDAARAAYAAATGRTDAEIAAGVAICSAQRNLRILGVFARLCLRDGKTHYPDFIPRTWDALVGDLTHPALAQVAEVVTGAIPPPTTDRLDAIRARAGSLAGRTSAGPAWT